MKRKFVAFMALVMSVLFMLTGLSGCNLITKDIDRDMNQVVAEISIADGVRDEITKRELILAYMNYGSSYTEDSHNHSQGETFEMILESLIKNKIILQSAMQSFDSGKAPFEDAVVNSDIAKWNKQRYITEDQIVEATYNTRKMINNLLDSYDESKVDLGKSDSLTEDVRTIPTGATNYVKELTVEEMKEYNAKPFDISSSKERRNAFNSTVALLKSNGLLGESYKKGQLETTAYYTSVLQSEFDSFIVTKFENLINKQSRSAFTFEQLEKAFVEKVDTQKEWNNEDFVSALSSASAGEPILYSGFGTYGYVYNLLLGADDNITAEIGKIDTTLSDSDKAKERKELLEGTVVKDLRSSWILSGYDFDGTKFTGDYTFTKPESSLEFKGTTKVVSTDADDKKVYSVESLKEFNLQEFIKMMEEYVYGSEQTGVALPENEYNIYKKVNSDANVEEYNEKINELLFAFSTDAGSLNTYKGYVIKPTVDFGDEEYVETFANAGRELLTMGKTSYIMVASDYGYHVMFFSEVFKPDYSVADNLVDYLNILAGETKTREAWIEEFNAMVDGFEDYEDNESYLYLLMNSISSSAVSINLTKIENDLINTSLYENNCVTTYKSRYSDLLGE